MVLSPINEIIEDIRLGRMVILMDDEDRENEGDLIMAASLVRPEDINFMARYGRGLICLTLTRDRCQQLNLPLMVPANGSRYGTNFTLSIEAAEGVSTGISAADRARTVLAAVSPAAKAADIVQPGHIFPLMAQPGGVLSRAGHTEAGCDLARLAGLEPAAVIVEILNEDGSMARRPDLENFAAEHGIKMGTIADLIEYRRLNEKTVERIHSTDWPTEHGLFKLISFRDTIDQALHHALVLGDIESGEPVPVRVHLSDFLADQLQGLGCQPSWSLKAAIERIGRAGRGVVVVLANSEDAEQQLQRLAVLRQGKPAANRSEATRTIGIGSQILAYLQVHRMILLSGPRKYHALSGFQLEVVDYWSPEA